MAKFQPKTIFDPFEATGIEVPKKNRKEALEAASEYLRDAILEKIGEGRSPLSGGEWTRGLTKKYAKDKDGPNISNLENSGDLLDSFFVLPRGSKLEVGVPASEAGKAEGNHLGTYGQEKSTGRVREFLLQPGDQFKRDIVSGLKEILQTFEEDDGQDS